MELRCYVNGVQNAQITWSKQGRALPSRSRVSNGVLYIDNVQYEDGGVYICSAGGEGLITVTSNINVNIGKLPKLCRLQNNFSFS